MIAPPLTAHRSEIREQTSPLCCSLQASGSQGRLGQQSIEILSFLASSWSVLDIRGRGCYRSTQTVLLYHLRDGKKAASGMRPVLQWAAAHISKGRHDGGSVPVTTSGTSLSALISTTCGKVIIHHGISFYVYAYFSTSLLMPNAWITSTCATSYVYMFPVNVFHYRDDLNLVVNLLRSWMYNEAGKD